MTLLAPITINVYWMAWESPVKFLLWRQFCKVNQQHRSALLSRDRLSFRRVTEQVVAWCLAAYPEVTLWRWRVHCLLFAGWVTDTTTLGRWQKFAQLKWIYRQATEYGAHIQALGEGW